jgi:2-keto-4-pentenoate hydratase
MGSTLKLTPEHHRSIAERLHAAIKAGKGIDPPSESIDYGFEDAYRIRRLLVDLQIADGGRPCGHKIGFTSEAMQKMYGMSGPDFGQLLIPMILLAGVTVPASILSDARVEPELAFELDRPLAGPGVTIEDVLDATRCVRACVEVIDSRVGAMRAKAVDSIADNAGAGRVVLGSITLGPRDLALDDIGIGITVDGVSLQGRSGEVMGHPAAPVAWLANKLAGIGGIGGSINAGDIVISGSATRSLPVRAGSRLHAVFGPFGHIDIDFT